MKAILISIKPEWVAKILNGEKTIEIRKTMPKCDLPIDVYIYCTKDDKCGLVWDNQGKGIVNSSLFPYGKNCPERHRVVNGKVVAKFTLNTVKEWHNYSWYEITKKGCVSDDELRNYSKGKASLYIWHIDNLVIFDKPKKLSEFNHLVKGNKLDHSIDAINYVGGLPLTKAPQSFMFIETEDK